MTLIIGIKCADGVVLGADGAATLGNAIGQSTVLQSMTKLEVLQGRIIMGVSGPVGLGQLYSDRVNQLWDQKKLGCGVGLPDAMRLLRDAILSDARVAIQGAAVSVPFLGQAAQIGALTHTVVALPIAGRSELIQFDYQGSPDAATEDLPYVAVGSAQSLADPFLAFVRRIFWPKSLPRLADGVFATVWTLMHSITVAPGGVSKPIQVATLKGRGQDWRGEIFTQEALDEHQQNIAEAERHLAKFRESPADLETGPPPQLAGR